MRPTLDESLITSLIVQKSSEELVEYSDSDVIIVGAGPAGLSAAYFLAKEGLKVLILERRLSYGGGINGGGNLFHKIVYEELEVEGFNSIKIAKELGLELEETEAEGIYLLDAAAFTATLAYKAIRAGAKLLLGWHVEDLIYRTVDGKVKVVGTVALWSPIEVAKLHVDPIFFKSKAVVDATGHGAEVLRIASQKLPGVSFEVTKELGAWAEEAERLVVEKTGKVLEGLYVAGMAVATLYRLPRMGPAISGMVLSGAKVAKLIKEEIKP